MVSTSFNKICLSCFVPVIKEILHLRKASCLSLNSHYPMKVENFRQWIIITAFYLSLMLLHLYCKFTIHAPNFTTKTRLGWKKNPQELHTLQFKESFYCKSLHYHLTLGKFLLRYLVAGIQLPKRKEWAPRALKVCSVFSLGLSYSAKKTRHIQLLHTEMAPGKAKCIKQTKENN